MSQALYRKWRPARFDDIIGQEHITRTLQNSIVAERIGHAYLFCGPRGTGKTTSARLLAKAVNCLHDEVAQRPCNECSVCAAIRDGRFLDLIEIDAASNTGVDDIRDLREKVNFAPNQGRYKVYIIDEVHMLSTAAFNALLKTLEEPPAHVIFILATTEEHKVPITIKSRCQQFNFRLLTETEIIGRLEWMAQKESLTVEREALSLIARQGAGSLRDAESLLDQLVTIPGDTITVKRAQMVLGTASNEVIGQLADAWITGDGARGLQLIHESLASGTDARQFCRQMVAYLRQLLLLQAAGEMLVFEAPAEQKQKMGEQAQRVERSLLIAAVKLFSEAAMTASSNWQPQLPLELAFVELLPEQPLAGAVPSASAVPAGAARPAAAPPQAQATSDPKPTPAAAATGTPEPATAAATTAASAAGPLTLAQVQAQWRSMLEQVGETNKNLPPLLNMSKPLGIEGQTIILGFDYPIFKEKFVNTEGAAQAIGAAFSTLLGTHCTIRTVITSDYSVPVSDEEMTALAHELGGVVREE
jgi:DNA polymerase III subunit gamma/tau